MQSVNESTVNFEEEKVEILPTEEDNGWVKPKSHKKKQAYKNALLKNAGEFTNIEQSVKQQKGSKPVRKSQESPVEEKLTPEDLVSKWIDSEFDETIWKAKSDLFDRMMKSLKNSDYHVVHTAANFVEYLSPSAQQFFQKVVEHKDVKTGNVTSLYDWDCHSFGHFYIVATSALPTKSHDWVSERMSSYESIINNNIEEYNGSVVISKKGYSILRRYAIKDLCMEFMNLRFFTKYEYARAFVINSVNGFVHFNKKSSESTDDSKWKEVSTTEWDTDLHVE